MMKAPDFDRKMLLLATQISHQSEMKSVLLAVLESLLRTLKIGTNGEMLVEAMSLMRCIVKLTLSLLVEPAANKYCHAVILTAGIYLLTNPLSHGLDLL